MPSVNLIVNDNKNVVSTDSSVMFTVQITGLKIYNPYLLEFVSSNGSGLPASDIAVDTDTFYMPIFASVNTPGPVTYYVTLKDKNTGSINYSQNVTITFTNPSGRQTINASNSSRQNSSSFFPGEEQDGTLNPDGTIKYSDRNPNSSSNTISNSLNSSTYNNISNLGSINSAPKCPSCPKPTESECTDNTTAFVICGCVILALLIIIFVQYRKCNNQEISK